MVVSGRSMSHARIARWIRSLRQARSTNCWRLVTKVLRQAALV
jgi:hypothetical protein